MSLFDWLDSPEGRIALAGVAGSAVSVAMEWSGFWPSVRKLFIGALTAYYLSPLGTKFFNFVFDPINVPEAQSASVGGFITGIGGVIIVEIILKAFRLRKQEIGAEKDAGN